MSYSIINIKFLGSYLHLSKGKLCDGSWSSLGCEVRIQTRTAHPLLSRPFLPFLVVEGIVRWRLNMDLLTCQEQRYRIFLIAEQWVCIAGALICALIIETTPLLLELAARRSARDHFQFTYSAYAYMYSRFNIQGAGHGVESRALLYTASA